MYGEQLKQDIESFVNIQGKVNPLRLGAERGTINRDTIKLYLDNIHFLVRHTPIHLDLAARISKERGFHDLQIFFEQKLVEESGHDKWAEADLLSLGKPANASQTILGSMHQLVDAIESAIRRSPHLYLPYILQAEYLTVLMAPAWLNDLENNCNIPRQSLSVIEKHAELDKEHVRDDLEILNALFKSRVSLDDLRKSLAHTLNLYDNFCREVIHVSDSRKL